MFIKTRSYIPDVRMKRQSVGNRINRNRMTAAAKTKLIELVQQNFEILFGQNGARGHLLKIKKWVEIASELNKLQGKKKEWQAWAKSYRDIKAKVKKKCRKFTQLRKKTGEGTINPKSVLTSDEEIVFDLIGHSVMSHSEALEVGLCYQDAALHSQSDASDVNLEFNVQSEVPGPSGVNFQTESIALDARDHGYCRFNEVTRASTPEYIGIDISTAEPAVNGISPTHPETSSDDNSSAGRRTFGREKSKIYNSLSNRHKVRSRRILSVGMVERPLPVSEEFNDSIKSLAQEIAANTNVNSEVLEEMKNIQKQNQDILKEIKNVHDQNALLLEEMKQRDECFFKIFEEMSRRNSHQ